MSSYNRVIIVGNLGHDPELHHTNGQAAVLTLSVATTEKFKDRSGKRTERTEWHRIVLWGSLAESCADHLRKGDRALFEGRLQYRKFENKEGREQFATEIVAQAVQFLGTRRGAEPVGDDPGDEVPTDVAA